MQKFGTRTPTQILNTLKKDGYKFLDWRSDGTRIYEDSDGRRVYVDLENKTIDYKGFAWL